MLSVSNKSIRLEYVKIDRGKLVWQVIRMFTRI